MATRIYSVSIDKAISLGVNSSDIMQMTDKEKYEKFVAPLEYDEHFSLDEFFWLLNDERLDTENNYFIHINI